MLKKCVCFLAMTFVCFSMVIPQETFADANNQRWNYLAIEHVCPDGTVLYTSETRSLETWTDSSHPQQTCYIGQICIPEDLREPNGPQICWEGEICYHTSHSVYWHNATYQTATQSIDSAACR